MATQAIATSRSSQVLNPSRWRVVRTLYSGAPNTWVKRQGSMRSPSASTHCWAASSLPCLLGEKLNAFACLRRESGELVRLEKAVGVDCSKLPEHLRAA